MLLKDKIIFVTGAGQGMGRGIAQAVAEAGADVVVSDLRLEPVQETAKLVETTGQRALPLIADVIDTEIMEQAIQQAVDTFLQSDMGGCYTYFPYANSLNCHDSQNSGVG